MKYVSFPLALVVALAAAPDAASAQAAPAVPDAAVAAPETRPANAAERPRPRRRNRNVITREEIAATHLSDAHSVVQRLRPDWFRLRGNGGSTVTAPAVLVYVDSSLEGDVATLRGMAAESIMEIRYYDSKAAAMQFGQGNGSTVIVVVYGGVPASD